MSKNKHKRDNQGRYVCRECGAASKSLTGLKVHMGNVHEFNRITEAGYSQLIQMKNYQIGNEIKIDGTGPLYKR